jgi:hypothetical protein
MNDKYSVFFETSEVLEAIKEDETEGVKKVSGIFMQAEKVNRNGRIYARETLQEAINEYQSIIQDGDSYGALDHPDNLEMKFNEASHFITKLEMIGNDVYGEAVLFSKTPSGQLIEDIFETKRKVGVPVKVGMSSRGAGKLVKRNNNSYASNKSTHSGGNYETSLVEGNKLLIESAISSGKKIAFKYKDKSDQVTQRTVSPQRIFWYQFDEREGQMLCLEAFCHLRNSSRTFALFRMTQIKLTA